jgi:hypothetical protein
MKNNISITAMDGGFTVRYSVDNPDYVKPTAGEKVAAYVPKTLSRTKIFTDTDAMVKFIQEHAKTLSTTDLNQDDYIW